MDARSIQLFKLAMENGKYKSFNLRIMVIGHFGVGKTTLTKRLLREEVNMHDCKSTEGIEIYVRKCKYDYRTKTWITWQKGNILNY